MHLQLVGKPHHRPAQTTGNVAIQCRRAIDINLTHGSRKAATGKQAHQAKDVIAVHVGNENAADLTGSQVTAQQLVLGGFTAVKEPNFLALGQPQSHTGNIACAGGHPRTGA